MESVNLPVYKKDDKTGCSSNRDILLLSISYTIFQHPVNLKYMYWWNYRG
jgi:hypothetical protein